MVLYDNFINQLQQLTEKSVVLEKRPNKLVEGDKNDILFTKDTAFELGGSQLPCVSTLAVSSKMHFSNSVFLLGKDLDKIKKDCAFAKLVFLEVDDPNDDDKIFNDIKDLEQVKYKFHAKDFMIRASAFNMREQIRVGKKAIKSGVSFADYGYKLVEMYTQKPNVKSVDIVFVTECEDFNALVKLAEKIKDTTSALNHILDNVLFDCSSCNLKPICDEVEGMKELHQSIIR